MPARSPATLRSRSWDCWAFHSARTCTPRIVAAAIALGLTCAITILIKAEHAPAGATTLIVALGILPNPIDFVFLMSAVVMLVILAFVVNRAFAIRTRSGARPIGCSITMRNC